MAVAPTFDTAPGGDPDLLTSMIDRAFLHKPRGQVVMRYVSHKQPETAHILKKPSSCAERRTSIMGGREVEHLHHHGQYAITKLCNASPQEIEKYDIAEMNLICARGLTGKHDIDIEPMLKLLDVWAKRCRTYILQKKPAYYTNPDKHGSLAKFYVKAMAQVLVKQLGVHYNPIHIADPSANPAPITDPADSFIHGILADKRAGMCATLPVMLVAIGRRLGYPIKLVMAPAHCFCRWDSSEERFNIEYDDLGVKFHPDDYYKEWPFKWNREVQEKEKKFPHFLVSLTPERELASFLQQRAFHLSIVGKHRMNEAWATMQVAYRLWPTHCLGAWLNHLTAKALQPHRDFPPEPCYETAGREAVERLRKEHNILSRND